MDLADLREGAVEDAVETLTDEQPEHWAFSARGWRDGLPERDDRWLDVFCTRRLNSGEGADTPDELDRLMRLLRRRPGMSAAALRRSQRLVPYDLPTPQQRQAYRRAFIRAMNAGIAACEKGCEYGETERRAAGYGEDTTVTVHADGYDPDEITANAADAARATLEG